MNQQAELIPGQSLDKITDSETVGMLQLLSCVWWVWLGGCGWMGVGACLLSMH